MPAYTTVVTHATGDVLPATDWNSYLRDNLAFLHDQGADLASAATVTPTNQFHRVTGTTTITAIAAPSGTGQGGDRILLKFQSAGCAITAGAALLLTNGPFVSVANGCIEFIWDSTLAGWVEIGRLNGQPGFELDYAQITAGVTPAATTEGTATAVITGNSITYDGTRVKVEFVTPELLFVANITANIVFLRDTTPIGQARAAGGAAVGSPVTVSIFDTPAAGAHTYKVAAFGSSASNFTLSAGLGGSGNLAPAYLRVTKA